MTVKRTHLALVILHILFPCMPAIMKSRNYNVKTLNNPASFLYLDFIQDAKR